MSELVLKLKNLCERAGRNPYVKLTRGENRKNNLRKSRRTCLTVFVYVAAIMMILFMSISSMGTSLTGAGTRIITAAALSSEIESVRTLMTELENYDTSEYSAEEMVDYENRLENSRRSLLTLEEAQRGNYDGKKYSVVYVNDTNVNTLGTRSWSYDNIFRSYVLDFLVMLIAIFISITVANIFGAEYSEKTVKLMFTKPSTRIKLFLCKTAVALKEALLYVTLGFLILLLVCWLDTGFDFKPMLCYIGNGVRTVGVLEQLLLCYANVFAVSMFYAMLAIFFSVTTKSRVLPIFCVILFSRLPELTAIQNLLMQTAQSSMGLYNALFVTNVDLSCYISFTQLVVKDTNFTLSFFVLLVYFAALFAASLLTFKNQRAMK